MPAGTLTISQKERIVAVVRTSNNFREAQKKLRKMKIKVSLGGLSKIMTRVKETHSVKDRKRSGRPRATTREKDNNLRRVAIQNRRLDVQSLTNLFNNSNPPPFPDQPQRAG